MTWPHGIMVCLTMYGMLIVQAMEHVAILSPGMHQQDAQEPEHVSVPTALQWLRWHLPPLSFSNSLLSKAHFDIHKCTISSCTTIHLVMPSTLPLIITLQSIESSMAAQDEPKEREATSPNPNLSKT